MGAEADDDHHCPVSIVLSLLGVAPMISATVFLAHDLFPNQALSCREFDFLHFSLSRLLLLT